MEMLNEHWNRIYRETEDHRLGWYEDDPAPTFRLLDQVPGWREATVFLPGAGTSLLVDALADAGAKLVLNDLSSAALERTRERLGKGAAKVVWNCQSVADPLDAAVPEVDIWIDRAVLHFLTDEHDIDGYFANVQARLKVGGHALFAEFAPHGAPKCAGLELHRYSVQEIAERLGDGFEMVDCFDHTYINPAQQPRPYLYVLFRRAQ